MGALHHDGQKKAQHHRASCAHVCVPVCVTAQANALCAEDNSSQMLRKEALADLRSFDVVVTTYEMACSQHLRSMLCRRIRWRYVVLDEGHRIKNEKTNLYERLLQLPLCGAVSCPGGWGRVRRRRRRRRGRRRRRIIHQTCIHVRVYVNLCTYVYVEAVFVSVCACIVYVM